MDVHRIFTLKKRLLYLKTLETSGFIIAGVISSSNMWEKDEESLYKNVFKEHVAWPAGEIPRALAGF